MSTAVTILGLSIVGLVLAGYVAQKYLPPPPPRIVGIDLGTTYSSIAVYHAVTGNVEVIADEYGRKSIPSVVCFLPNGTVLVGDAAVQQSEHNPTRTFYDAKRFIGKQFLDENEFRNEAARYPFQVLLNDHKRALFKLEDSPQRPFLKPEEISTLILLHLKRMAEKQLGTGSISKAVISVPAEFDDEQRNATLQAARQAGLEVYRIINEPTAAALAYGLHKKTGVDHVLIVDLGGGTLDVSLLTIQGGMLITRAMAGNNHLGGQDFTQRLFDRLLDVVHQHYGSNVTDKEDLQNLRAASENVKLTLTNVTWTEVDVHLHSLPGDDHDRSTRLRYVVTRDEFEMLNDDLFRKVFKPIEAALKDIGASKEDVDEVVLVGGSTRIPKLRKIIGDYFKKEPNYDVDPELAVVTGVAVQSGVITGGWPLQVSATELPTKLKKIHVYD